ncbi:MAG: MarR family transcriptional regulator [Burkholderiaceae bacterium]
MANSSPQDSAAPRGADEPTAAGCDPAGSLKFGLMLHQVREALIRRIESRVCQSDLDINFSQFRVLKALFEGHASTASEIARCVGHDAGALTRLLDRLAERGLLRRQPRTTDRRQVDVVLTDEGRAAAQRIVRAAADTVTDALRPLSDDEREALMRMLERIRDGLDEPAAAGAAGDAPCPPCAPSSSPSPSGPEAE